MENIKLDNGYKLVFEKAFEEDEAYQCTGYILKDDELSDNFSGIGLFATFEDVKIELMKYLIQIEKVEITKDNIHLYYEFMNDKDIQSNISIVETIISDRFNIIKNCINIEKENLKLHLNFEKRTVEGKITIVSGACGAIEIFGVKDSLMPIDEYINKIKSSDAFINFEKEKSLKQLN